MTPAQLSKATGATLARAAQFLPHLEPALGEFHIHTPGRQAMFLAQVGHESGGLRWLSEIWGPTPAQARYEGRADLGNTQPGDGSLYRGRGLIQITGRANYAAAGAALNLPLVDFPVLLEGVEYATRSAAWFWGSRGLNELADREDFERITRRINGGLNGYDDRLARLRSARSALAC